MAFKALRSSALRPVKTSDDTDPMASLANLADVMLVFACGLMLSLITYWNIDVSAATEVLADTKVSEIENPEDITNQLKTPDGTSYLDMGRVYMDPTTGKYYMVVDSGSEQAEALEESVADAANPAASSDGEASNQAQQDTASASAQEEADRVTDSAAAGQIHALPAGQGGSEEGSTDAEGD